jgi:uncharacterized surface protein with fasciclin (FAS1) repeats
VPAITVPPAADTTLWDIVRASPDLSRLEELVQFAGLVEALDGSEEITLLAPSDDAFDLLESSPGGADLLGDEDAVRDLLLRHVVAGAVPADELLASDSITVANGDTLSVDTSAGTIEGARIVVADVEAANGLLHVIDFVLVP